MASSVALKISDFQIQVLKCFLAVLALYFAYVYVKKRKAFVELIDRIPGPKPRFFIGNLQILGIFSSCGNPYKDLQKLFLNICGLTILYSKGIFRLWLSAKPVIMVYKYSTFETIMNNKALGEKTTEYRLLRPMMGTGLVTSSLEKNRKRRKLILPGMNSRLLEGFVHIFNCHSRLTVQKLHSMLGEEFVNVVQIFNLCSLSIICDTAMGIQLNFENKNELEYSKSVNEIEKMVLERGIRPWLWPDIFYFLSPRGKKCRRALNIMNGFTRKVIEERKRTVLSEWRIDPEEPHTEKSSIGKQTMPFLDILLAEHLKNPNFTEEDILEEVNTFMAAGFDTTTLSMSWTLYLIGLHQDVQEKLHAELNEVFGDDWERPVTTDDMKQLTYLECVIKESLRIYPTIPLVGREITEDISIEGFNIPKGIGCYLMLFTLHRDPEIFPEPERFIPERFFPENSFQRHPCAYLPFSGGSRSCVGQRFSMMEEKTVLSHILRNFSVTSLDQRDKMVMYSDIALRTPSVRIKFTSRQRL